MIPSNTKTAEQHNFEQENDEPTLAMAWLGALLNPVMLVQGLTEAFISWLFTRPWRLMAWFIPAIGLVIAAVGLIIYGYTLSRHTLQLRYLNLADQELKRLNDVDGNKKIANTDVNSNSRSSSAVSAVPTQPFMEEKTSAYSDMLYRRLMNLDETNVRSKYMVAMQLTRSRRMSQARLLMQAIAPAGEKGYPPAHAWLAIDALSRQPLSNEDQELFMSHMREAANWDGIGGGLIRFYAVALEARGRNTEALDAMGKAVQRDPNLKLDYSMMAKRMKMTKIANEASTEAKKMLEARIKESDATIRDYIQLIILLSSESEFRAAHEMARKALSKFAKGDETAEEADLIRTVRYYSSESLRLLYRQSIKKTEKGLELNLALLDAAMKEYPTNPQLTAEIAMLEEMGVDTPPALKAAMENQLANGQSTALAHLVLANQDLKAGRLSEAVPHLELTLKQAPNHPVALNNLALSLAITDPSQLVRAEQLIDKAIASDRSNPEYFDTQGEIRLIAKRPLDALTSLELALGLDPTRIHTRELMAKAYRAAGMEDLANQQTKAIEDAKAKKDGLPSSTGPTPSASPSPSPNDGKPSTTEPPTLSSADSDAIP